MVVRNPPTPEGVPGTSEMRLDCMENFASECGSVPLCLEKPCTEAFREALVAVKNGLAYHKRHVQKTLIVEDL